MSVLTLPIRALHAIESLQADVPCVGPLSTPFKGGFSGVHAPWGSKGMEDAARNLASLNFPSALVVRLMELSGTPKAPGLSTANCRPLKPILQARQPRLSGRGAGLTRKFLNLPGPSL